MQLGAAGFLVSSGLAVSVPRAEHEGEMQPGEWSGKVPAQKPEEALWSPFSWGLSCSAARQVFGSRWAWMSPCSGSHVPAARVCRSAPHLPSLSVLGCGKASWPHFCLKVLGPPRHCDLSLGPGCAPRPPSRSDHRPASFCSASPLCSSPPTLPWPCSLWMP